MFDRYFIEMDHMIETKEGEGVQPKVEELLRAWLPSGNVPLASFVKKGIHWGELFDYVLVTEDSIYFAQVLPENEGYTLNSLKCFRASDIISYAFMLGAKGNAPELRLMLSEGKRIKLIFEQTEEPEAVLQTLATSKFLSGH